MFRLSRFEEWLVATNIITANLKIANKKRGWTRYRSPFMWALDI